MPISPEKNRAKVKAWRLANPEKYRAQEKARREKHGAKRRAYMVIWRKENRDLARAAGRRHAANKRTAAAMKAAAEAKAIPSKPSPAVARLLALAEAKATQASYGITRVAYQ